MAVLFGLATLSYTRHPEGFLDFLGGRVQAAVARRRADGSAARRRRPPDRRRARAAGPAPADAGGGRRGGVTRSRPAAPLLVASGITKQFGGIVALDHVDLEVGAGEAVGIVGPNGAGKTTLFNCLFGLEDPDEGTVVFDGRRIDRLPVWQRSRLGIGRTFQRMELFEGMTVADHLLVAEQAASGTVRIWRDFLHRGGPTPGRAPTTSRRSSTCSGWPTWPAGRSTPSTSATPGWWSWVGR